MMNAEMIIGDFRIERVQDEWSDSLSILDETYTGRDVYMTRTEAELLRDALNKLYPIA